MLNKFFRATARSSARALLAASLCCSVATVASAADPIEEFYKGKSLRIYIGYAAGGGYDIYGRVFAEHFGRFLPGNPQVVPQNMPGAGSFVAAKYLYNVAPKDGTAFGMVSQTLPLDAAMNEDPETFDVTKLPYIGRLLDNVDVGAGRPDSWFKTFEDVRNKEIVVGATGGASPGFLVPTSLVKYAGAKFKIVSGYGGSADIYLASQRKEVDLIGSVGLPFILQRHPEWVKERAAPILYQTALKRHPLLPHVPTIGELGLSEEGRGVLNAVGSSSEIGRSVITTPGVPKERLDALRKAFQAMMADKTFIETMDKRQLMTFAATGEEMDKVTQEVMKTPKPVLALTKALLTQK